MKKDLEKIYQQKNSKKKHLLSLKNKYFAIIYKGCLQKDSVKKIHKALYDATINTKPQYADKFVLGMFIKFSNKAKKVQADGSGLLAVALLDLFTKQKMNDKAKKLINYEVTKEAEKQKDVVIQDFIKDSRSQGKYFYLASSHNDCAKDHLAYQGKMYVDNKAPEDIIEYARQHNMKTLQWVMVEPVWFITRPNCRHYFVSLSIQDIERKSLKKLRRKYKMHSNEGDRDFSTPAKVALEEYQDRLKMLRALYAEYPTLKLKKEIEKTELLVKKWKNAL